jgi:predicted DNA-binding transcriptional regulator AlpA
MKAAKSKTKGKVRKAKAGPLADPALLAATAQIPRVVREPIVTLMTGLKRSTIYKMEVRGEFPRRFPLASSRASGWYLHEVVAWQEKQAASREPREPLPRRAKSPLVAA